MYSIEGDVTFDDYAVDINEDYLCEDFDYVELGQSQTYNTETNTETDIQFE